jgi:hypothetical protein
MDDRTSTVWMVHSGTDTSGVKGDLSLDPRGVVFTPRQAIPADETVFDLDDVTRVRRVRGSPILELRMRRSITPKVVGFYFVQPPSLEAQRDSAMMTGRRMRREAAVSLFKLNPVKREEVAWWVEAIKQAREA